MYRQLHTLSASFTVVACGCEDPGLEGVEFILLDSVEPSSFLTKAKHAARLLSRRHDAYYWGWTHMKQAITKLSKVKPDIIIANDIDALPLALKISNGAKVIFDAHEYAPREFEDNLIWRVFFQAYKNYLCHRYIPYVDGMITVSQSIADEYERCFGRKPIVLTNAAEYHFIEPRKTDPSRIRMIHHGIGIKSRRTETLIDMMDLLDGRFELHLMLVPGSPQYIEALKNRARSKPNIKFVEAVPMTSIVPTLALYDVGIYFVEPSNFNYRYALPNKFFEFIQARLALVGGPSPEMARIVLTHECGVVAQNFSPKALALALTHLTAERIDGFKRASNRLARFMSAETNCKSMLELVEDLINSEKRGKDTCAV